MHSLFLLIALLIPMEQPDTLVVCPPDFQAALQPWVEYRQDQGHTISIIESPKTARELTLKIRDLAKQNEKLKTVLLVGDSNGTANTVPTNYIDAEVNVLYGAQPKIATDNRFADLDDDGIPDLAIGRIPIDSPEELAQSITRIINYEQNNSGDWLQQINFVAGVGGFGALIDKLIEQTAKQMITEMIPGAYRTSMTYGSWTSPYCPDPRRFSETSIAKFNEGCLFWVYIGHGATHRLDRIYMPDQSYQILNINNTNQLKASEGNPIAIFLACSTAGFDDETDCLAEAMLKQEAGPIAVLASSRVAMPYGLSIFTLEVTREYFAGNATTLGELVMLAKQRLVSNKNDDSRFRQAIEALGKSFSPKQGLLEAERSEHVDLMHLLGDPLLKVKRPETLEMTVEIDSDVKKIAISGEVPFDGTIQLTLSYRRDRFRFRPPRRAKFEPDGLDSYQETYEKNSSVGFRNSSSRGFGWPI